jgi:phage recombination protein Bet
MSLPSKIVNTISNVLKVIKDTLYPGASDEEATMIIEYCQERKVDPMLKPVHLVPMYVSTGKKDANTRDIKAMRSVVMPGIGLYRIIAERSGCYAGLSDPIYGEDISERIGTLQITYPKWCKITVKKILHNGSIAEFSATEYWKENYASKGKDDSTPNAMWSKRIYAQLAKCAEAQALRKAFPDSVGNEVTYEEMQGKEHDAHDEPKQFPRKSTIIVKSMEPKDIKNSLYDDSQKFLIDIANAESIEELQQIFDVIKRLNFRDLPDIFKQLVDAKDTKKIELQSKKLTNGNLLVHQSDSQSTEDFLKEYDGITGELK